MEVKNYECICIKNFTYSGYGLHRIILYHHGKTSNVQKLSYTVRGVTV